MNSATESIFRLDLSDRERMRGTYDHDRLALAVEALRVDGIVVLEDVVSDESVLALRTRMLADVREILARNDVPYNWTRGNIQQAPPPRTPYLFRDVLVNDFAIQVTKAILGGGLKCGFYSGNTCLPSESRQPVHADEGQLWPNLTQTPPAHALVVNIPLVDMGPENGSTEMWLGTHLDPSVVKQSGDIEVAEDVIEARRSIRPPLQPAVKAGSIVIRDIRMWHAGMPNRTETPRPMIAMIHSVAWWPTTPVAFADGVQDFLAHADLNWVYTTHADEIDHIGSSQGFMAEFAR